MAGAHATIIPADQIIFSDIISVKPWKRYGNALSRHSVKLSLHLVFLLEISSACRSLLCHNEMVVLYPIM